MEIVILLSACMFFLNFARFGAAVGRIVAREQNHVPSVPTSASQSLHHDVPIGSYVTAEVGHNKIVRGLLHTIPATDTAPFNLFVRFPNNTRLVADLYPLNYDNNNHDNNQHPVERHWHEYRCFFQIQYNYFLSSFLDVSYRVNNVQGKTLTLLKIQHSTKSYLGIVDHLDGTLPDWAKFGWSEKKSG
ncbi:uncharacterized protein LOC117170609 isoform X2 [Belonocnema kinseyi]|nr:uncharacterized protein LOC117170609 isoform X2 [Belonocnema kinseyi]